MDTAAAFGTSPMMLAYMAAQTSAPDHIILYRVGEFYEVLGKDAFTVSRTLGLQLTRRRQKDAADVPMCGIPSNASDQAIARLLAAGHKVAVSEQPIEGGDGRPLRRFTAATSVDADVVPGGRPNNLTVALTEDRAVAFAWTDLSTGETGVTTASLEGCGPALARISPAEILVARWPADSEALAIAVRSFGAPFSNLPDADLCLAEPGAALAQVYGDGWRERLRGFSPAELAALAALLNYVRGTLGRLPDGLPAPRRTSMGDTLQVDAPTLRGLEVLTSASGRNGSLLSVVDRTVTAAGARLLARQLVAPLTSSEQIGRRLAMVRFLLTNPEVRTNCREDLGAMPDMLRACGRLSLGKGGPRDLGAIRDGLEGATAVTARLRGADDLPSGLASAARELAAASEGACVSAARSLRRALTSQLPGTVKEPGFVKAGYAARLDEARSDAARMREAVDELQARLVVETGVKALRIRVNTLVGYHVEVPSAQAKALGDGYTLRQGLASSTRFSTSELDLLAARLEDAKARVAAAEQAVFTELSRAVLDVRAAVARVAHAAAALDLVAGLAQAAAEGMWTEPDLVDGAVLDIEDGRHPVAERLLEAQGRSFVANDCRMGEGNRIWLLTGPNMAGKSTYLRQVALIVLMAQVGSFVPAKRARIGVVDKLFSRIGASDDLAAGRSTFLVEMLETAAILTQATERSLVILDEVGRGTSTHDGLAIAQATMEHLHDVVGCRTLFATHFHELADAADAMRHAECMAMDASAGRHGDVFTFKVAPGRAG
ncbi:DNA mismatch repair protein MutS, partial [Acidisphaera sp. L21]|uniref:DNA mismatch repair protein MutS n=1 Tax=Acidisphaera sp. L21 TaxID=1641851 RepID=UPI00131B42E6